MANTTYNVTRAQALTTILEVTKDMEFEDDTRAVLENMLLRLSASKSQKESTVAKTNRETLQSLIAKITDKGEEGITAREFSQELPWTTDKAPVQKATRILVQGVNEGVLETVMPEKKSQPMRYRVKTNE